MPETIQGLQQLIRNHQGSISIGGGRYSMGGQIVPENSLHIAKQHIALEEIAGNTGIILLTVIAPQN